MNYRAEEEDARSEKYPVGTARNPIITTDSKTLFSNHAASDCSHPLRKSNRVTPAQTGTKHRFAGTKDLALGFLGTAQKRRLWRLAGFSNALIAQ